MAKIIELPIIYENSGKAPKCRNPGTYYVAGTAKFTFRELDPTEVEPALQFVAVNQRPNGEVSRYCEDIQQFDGKLIRPMSSMAGELMTIEELSGFVSLRLRQIPNELRVPSRKYSYDGSTGHYDATQLKERHVDVDGFLPAVSELQDLIDRTLVIVDGQLHQVAPDPVYDVWIGNDVVTFSPHRQANGHFSFPADCYEEAMEFARWCADEYGLGIKLEDNRRIEVLDPSFPVATNPVIAAALFLAGRAELNYEGSKFGPDVKQKGLALTQDPTVENGIAFVDAFEAAVLEPGAPAVSGWLGSQIFTAFRKFVELVPEKYGLDEHQPISFALLPTPVSNPGFR